jgi:hypothetical protein
LQNEAVRASGAPCLDVGGIVAEMQSFRDVLALVLYPESVSHVASLYMHVFASLFRILLWLILFAQVIWVVAWGLVAWIYIVPGRGVDTSAQLGCDLDRVRGGRSLRRG